MNTSIQSVTIKQIQGRNLKSPLAGETVRTKGLVTGVMSRGFFMQTANVEWDGQASDAVFVYSQDWQTSRGTFLEVTGVVVDYLKHEAAKPVTQIHLDKARTLENTNSEGGVFKIEPIKITRELLPDDNPALANLLNSLAGMLVSIAAGQTFISPSNPFGDYVLALDAQQLDHSMQRTEHSGALVNKDNPLRWFPGFRVTKYNHAPRLNVGAKLLSGISGPLNYRVGAYQISVSDPFKIEPSFIGLNRSTLHPSAGSVTVMTLNCFNLDPHIESEDLVLNPRQDVDDDWGEGRFHTLAQAVVLQANTPDIVALQEIQDSDGAEMTQVVEASGTYRLLVKTIEQLSGVSYRWVDVPPELGADGGQPGGNIRNAYLYNPDRVSLIENSVNVLGKDDLSFAGSRKPLIAKFREHGSSQVIACINVHLASKRHQNSIFEPLNPGVDAKQNIRVDQAKCVAKETEKLREQGIEYYVTGDFNDTENSRTLQVIVGAHNANLVESLPAVERYDYNHRGKLQVLMHGIVSIEMAADRAEYEIIHGNELIGVKPGEESDKPSDHAYVIAKLKLAFISDV